MPWPLKDAPSGTFPGGKLLQPEEEEESQFCNSLRSRTLNPKSLLSQVFSAEPQLAPVGVGGYMFLFIFLESKGNLPTPVPLKPVPPRTYSRASLHFFFLRETGRWCDGSLDFQNRQISPPPLHSCVPLAEDSASLSLHVFMEQMARLLRNNTCLIPGTQAPFNLRQFPLSLGTNFSSSGSIPYHF